MCTLTRTHTTTTMIIVNNNYNNKIQKEIRQEIIKGGRRE